MVVAVIGIMIMRKVMEVSCMMIVVMIRIVVMMMVVFAEEMGVAVAA